MTLLSLLTAGYRKLQRKIAQQYTYDSMEHLNEHLLKDIGMVRRGNRIVALGVDESFPSITSETDPVKTTASPAVPVRPCCQDSGG